MLRTLKDFAVPLVLSVIIAVAIGWYLNLDAVGTLILLIILEIVFSFDNAVVNSKILVKMSPFWQKIFLSFGLIFAVGFMRLLFPVLVVVTTASLSFGQAFSLAFHHPDAYKVRLDAAHPAIVALGGMFLLMLFLDWIFSSERELDWLGPIERGIRRLAIEGKEDILSSIIAFAVLVSIAKYHSGGHTEQMLLFGTVGWVIYQIVNLIGSYTEARADALGEEDSSGKRKLATGGAAFGLFVQLELIDASFSFDGVSGAFAITSNIVIIMAGLGVGALFIRTLTVKLVRSGTLGEYVFLEHGAYWAIGSLAVLLFATVEHQPSEYVTGGIGVGIIILAWLTSLLYRHNHADEAEAEAAEIDDELAAEKAKIAS